jgi:RNase P/RNase MRP subunit p29
MNSTKYTLNFLNIFLVICLTVLSQAAYAGIAGNVQFVNGNVQVTNTAGQTHALQKGDVIHESDTVTTTKGASVQIKMRDGGFIVIRPESQLKFDSFVFSGEEDGSEKSFFSLLKGGIRAITGLIGHKNKSNYRIVTANSTIGIRGTDHETFVVVPGSELAATVPVGTYNKVIVGETTMTTDKGTISVLPNQMGFAGGLDQVPQLQPINLNIFTVTPAPLAQAKGAKGAVRDSAIVDKVIQGQDAAQGDTVPKNQIQTPIKSKAVGPVGGTVF